MDAVIHVELVAFEVDAGEQRVLGEGVIGDQIFAGRQQVVHSAALLVIAAQQKEDLRLKRISFAVGIEIGQKRILLEDFEQNLGIKCILKKAGEGGLPNSDDPF